MGAPWAGYLAVITDVSPQRKGVARSLDCERRGKRRAVSRMKDHSIQLALVDAGFEHVGEGLPRGEAVHEEVYKAPWSTEEVEHFIYVSDHRGDLTEPKLRDLVWASFGMKMRPLKTLAARRSMPMAAMS
jgi:hypothetical protein